MRTAELRFVFNGGRGVDQPPTFSAFFQMIRRIGYGKTVTLLGVRPLPKVIAWGQTLGSPPLQHEEPQVQRRVPLVVVYDGQQIEIGRVVVDSTWHHWFNMNLKGLEENPDQTSYQKVLRYFVNVAIWLAKPGWRASMTLGGLKATEFDYFGLEGFTVQADPDKLGLMALRQLGPIIGPCWVRDLASEAVATIERQISTPSGPDRPADDYVHAVVLGEIVKELFSDAGEALGQLAKHNRIQPPRNLPADPMEVAIKGARRGLAHVARRWRNDIERSREHLDRVESSLGATEKNAP